MKGEHTVKTIREKADYILYEKGLLERLGELWNFDLWFFDRETIERAESYCDGTASRAAGIPGARESIIEIKQELLRRGLYGFGEGKYISMDVYRAVLEQGVTSAEQFLKSYRRGQIWT